ncbi:MAG: threonylcarbamoyl-AMP synthase [Lachnospiraceae bacterium]|nr:threonylcarbamoyl-AMP synthase [Lachnospiraceae bacterium]
MITEMYRVDGAHLNKEKIEKAASILRAGGLVGFPTETVYGLGGDGLNPDSAKAIYAAKGRPSDNPLILHIASRAELAPLVAEVPASAEKLMDEFWPGPMTLVFKKSQIVPLETTGGLETVAIRMPSHPVARALIEAAGVPIAAPSANTSGRPSPTQAAHVWEDMQGRIPMILDGGEVGIGLESTIIDLTGAEPTVLRPGYITPAMIEEIVGHTELDLASLGQPEPGMRPKAPGMKYRHYAPKAKMTLVDGEQSAVCQKILELAESAEENGKRVRIICTEETASCFAGFDVACAGKRSEPEEIAHNLFRILRDSDHDGVDILLSETFGETELGQAIMNRLMKAAGYHIIYI